jgi:hypothetical protein
MGAVCILHHAIDGDPDRTDRLHRQAALHPAWTDPSVATLGQSKGLVGDQALVMEVGRLELQLIPSPPCEIGAPIGV